MSWFISATGTQEKVKMAVQAVICSGDPSQLNLVKALVAAELARLPEGVAVEVVASGHHDFSPGSPNADLNVKIRTLKLLV